VFSVGLPNTSHSISVSSSVRAPSATSHTLSAICDASSNSKRMRRPLLCRPAKAAVLFSDHVAASQRHSLEPLLLRRAMLVASNLNQCRQISRLNHFDTSGHVLVRSWSPVLAVITTLVSGAVASPQRITQDTSADLPIPCPDAVAMRSAPSMSSAVRASAMMFNVSICHGRGPVSFASSVPGSPHGNA